MTDNGWVQREKKVGPTPYVYPSIYFYESGFLSSKENGEVAELVMAPG
jgi:hypothetical protein